jgi:hypothetical protein
MDLSDDTFRQQAQIHGGVISNIREVRHTLGQMRLASYTIGRDGRNRVFLNPYGSVTGRNQPSNSKFLFGSARWVRSFIKPPEGHAVAYVDWKTQEVGIAAALSGDAKMWEDYNTGDIYMAFAKRAGLAPDTATKTTHGDVRSVCKRVVLGLGFGLTYIGLALQLGCKQERARQLVQLHEESYRTYHTWANQQSMAGALGVPLRTPFQWERRIKAGGKCNLRSLKNFYMQGTGAEMMRVAACMLTEAGISVCAPIHDAFLIEATIENATRDIAATTQIMSDASELVLGKGFTIGADVETVVTYPEIYRDAAGGEMYERVMKIAREADRAPCGQSQI